MNKRRILPLVLLFGAFLALIFFWGNRDSDVALSESSKGDAAEESTGTNSDLKSNSTQSEPVESKPVQSTPSVQKTESYQIARDMLRIEPGHVTQAEADALIDRLVAAEGSAELFEEWLAAGNLEERLLAAYSVLESEGPTTWILETALRDPSPQIRAEIARWLFKQHRFPEMHSFLEEAASRLAAEEANRVIAAFSSDLRPEVAVALKRLGIGEGVPIYLELLGRQSPQVVRSALDALSGAELPGQASKVLLQIVVSANPPDLLTDLKELYAAETDTATRIAIGQHIAARVPKSDQETWALLESGLPLSGNGLEPTVLISPEQRLEMVTASEDKLRDMLSSDRTDPMGINGLLRRYIEQGAYLGESHLSAELLEKSANFLQERQLILSPETVAWALYIAGEIQSAPGTATASF